jgi:hypothetical protein
MLCCRSLFFALVMLTSAPALAQDSSAAASDDRRTTYPREFFAQYSPSNALDMVRRVPGFTIQDDGGEVRGFGGAAGNVVLNGARASSKSDSLEAILSRIPASRVLRVEVGPGDLFGSDFAGKSQVVNLVLSNAGGIDGNVKASLVRIGSGKAYGDVEGSVLIRTGSSTINLSAGSGRWREREVGYDDLRRVSSGLPVERRDKANTLANNEPYISASWSHERDGGYSEHANLRYSPEHFTLNQTNHVVPVIGPVRDDRFDQVDRNASYELGGDISRPLGGGVIKFVALANRRTRNGAESNLNRVQDTVIGGFAQTSLSRYDEVLGRLSWTQPKLAGFSAEFGGELALNRLNNVTELFRIDAGGVRSRIILPVTQVRVQELRGEGYVNLGRQLGSQFRLDTTLAYELSRLKVTGDTSASRRLGFFKPGVTLDWKSTAGWHAQLSIKRRVDQLDFYDFISSAELNATRINGGNAELQPQRTWEARLTIERPFWKSGKATLDLGYDWATALKERILTPDGLDAVGNIGSGKRGFARLAVDTPLDPLGLRATRLKIEGTVQRHRVTDPLTGINRMWSDRSRWKWQADLRRDLARWSYGVSFNDNSGSSVFRTDEIDSFYRDGPSSSAFAEFRPDKRTTMRLDAENILDNSDRRQRLFFDPDRRTGNAAILEDRLRASHVRLVLSINRTFGSGGK